MTTDAQALARELLARAGAAPRPAPLAAPGPVGATRAGGARARLDDLPQVRESLRRDRVLAEGMASLGAPNPYYRQHRGVNGATIEVDGVELINYSGYNYLGLAGDERVAAAAKAAVDQYGTSGSAARIVSGNLPLHDELEAELARAYGAQDAVLVGSGFLANASVLAYVLGEKDLALCDSLVHNSIVSGTLWAGCRRMQFRHNDPDALDGVLSRTRDHFEQVLVVLEGVYSMDGDVCRLPELLEVARRHNCLVMLDEAHSFGVLGGTGLGLREHFGLAWDDVDLWMGTLSKSLASYGGFLVGSHAFIQACRMSAPGMSLYAAAPTPATTAAALAALRLMRAEPERVRRLQANAELFLRLARRAGLPTGPAEGTPIVPVVLGSTEVAATAGVRLAELGVNVQAMTYPVVPEGEARLRFFLSADHTSEQLQYTVSLLASLMPAAGGGSP